MTWESSDTFQQLIELQPALKEQQHRDAFSAFINRMWTKPATYTDFAKAYMEFTTSSKLTFPKLNALAPSNNNSTRSKRSKRSRRRRSRRKRKTSKA